MSRAVLFAAVGRVRGKRPLTQVFDDSLEGDLSRFAVLRELRRTMPEATPQERESLIEEYLEP